VSDTDPSTNLSDALSELIAFDAQGRAVWPARELAGKLEEPLSQLSGDLNCLNEIQTVRELLEHPNPPIEMLMRLKDLSKRRPTDLFPPEMALLLYYGSIAAGMVRCGKSITKLRDEDLRNGFTWTIKQPWVPESICELFRRALSQLSGGQKWRE
jgi:hypothetical protein